MSKREWKVGQKYRLVDVAGFTSDSLINKDIANVVKEGIFTVSSVTRDGSVGRLKEHFTTGRRWDIWFNESEIKYFKEVDEVQDNNNNTDAVVEWLDKFLAVGLASNTDESIGIIFSEKLRLETMYGNVYEASNIVEVINTRYTELAEQAIKTKRKALLEEVAKAKAEYDAKVTELELLEGK